MCHEAAKANDWRPLIHQQFLDIGAVKGKVATGEAYRQFREGFGKRAGQAGGGSGMEAYDSWWQQSLLGS